MSKRITWKWIALLAIAVIAYVGHGLHQDTNRIFENPALAQVADVPAGPKVVRANYFVLEDENGQSRGAFAVIKDSVVLTMIDDKGHERMTLKVDQNGPVLRMVDEKEKLRIGLAAAAAGPLVRLYDQNAKCRANIEVSDTGPTIRLNDKFETSRVLLAESKDGIGISLQDGKAHPRAMMVLGNKINQEPGLFLLNEKGGGIWSALK